MNSLLVRSIFVRNLTRTRNFWPQARIASFSRPFASKTPDKEDHDPDKPLEYLQSKAASWKAQDSTQYKNVAPEIEMYSIIFSVAVFMIYFCYLREENDVDETISRPLFDSVPGLEVSSLLVMHKYNFDNQKSNKEIEARMREIGIDVEAVRKSYMS
ncbi:uncharacterized protein LOC134828899 [Culicoides brevitarsis]|uniref:uncharacterized protein LOC134828899 n=1 Tax=Culicoides brevitarsis TaxID=469753 RepID=UPI00307BB46A